MCVCVCVYSNSRNDVPRVAQRYGWLVDFGFNGPLRQYFSLYRAVSQREGEREETQRHGTIAAHTRRRASVFVVFVVFACTCTVLPV